MYTKITSFNMRTENQGGDLRSIQLLFEWIYFDYIKQKKINNIVIIILLVFFIKKKTKE